MRTSLAFHIIGIVMWLGGLMVGTSAIKESLAGENREQISSLTKRVWYGFILPGLCIATASGIFQVSYNGFAFYMKQGWFHIKLTALVVLFAATYMLSLEIKKIVKKEQAARSRIMMVHGMSGLVLLVIVFATMLGR